MIILMLIPFVDKTMADESFHFKYTIPIAVFLSCLLFTVMFNTYESFVKYFPTCMTIVICIIVTEKTIIKNPVHYAFSEP